MLEDALREMLAAKAGQSPLRHDVAGEAVRRGRAARRRRMVMTSTAAVVVLVMTLAGAVFLQSRLPSARGAVMVGPGRPTATATATSAPAPRAVPDTGIAVDLLAGDQLWTAAGQLLTMGGVGGISRAYRVPAGWVYGGADQVRLLRPDGSSVSLSGRGESWTLSPDGTGIAFVVERTLHIGHVGTAGLAVTGSVEMSADAVPVAFVGRRVLIVHTGSAAGADRRYELLDPATGAVWGADLAAVYGTRGTEVVALGRTPEGLCLVTLRSGDGTVARRGGCGLALTPDAVAAPDGARLAVRAGGNLRVIDIAEALRGRAGVAATCPVGGDGPVGWADRSTVLAGVDGTVVTCTITGGRDTVQLPPVIGGTWRFAPAPTAG